MLYDPAAHANSQQRLALCRPTVGLALTRSPHPFRVGYSAYMYGVHRCTNDLDESKVTTPPPITVLGRIVCITQMRLILPHTSSRRHNRLIVWLYMCLGYKCVPYKTVKLVLIPLGTHWRVWCRPRIGESCNTSGEYWRHLANTNDPFMQRCDLSLPVAT